MLPLYITHIYKHSLCYEPCKHDYGAIKIFLKKSKSNITRKLYHNLYANSDKEELKQQGLRLPKTLFYDFKIA